jgi:hypothetical protein
MSGASRMNDATCKSRRKKWVYQIGDVPLLVVNRIKRERGTHSQIPIPTAQEPGQFAAQYPNGDPAVAMAFVPSMTKSPRHMMPHAVRVNS